MLNQKLKLLNYSMHTDERTQMLSILSKYNLTQFSFRIFMERNGIDTDKVNSFKLIGKVADQCLRL